MARKKIIAGNWKMNKTPSEAVALVKELTPLVKNDDVDVVFCVPAIDIIPAMEAAKGTNINIGAENMYFEESGAYTGEIAPNMLVDARLLQPVQPELRLQFWLYRISMSQPEMHRYLLLLFPEPAQQPVQRMPGIFRF